VLESTLREREEIRRRALNEELSLGWSFLCSTLNAKFDVVGSREDALLSLVVNQGEHLGGNAEADGGGLPRGKVNTFVAKQLLVGLRRVRAREVRG